VKGDPEAIARVKAVVLLMWRLSASGLPAAVVERVRCLQQAGEQRADARA